MQQDQDLVAEQGRERLAQIADLALAQVASTLGTWELALRELDALPPRAAMKSKFPPNSALAILANQSVATYPNRKLLFVPDPPPAAPLPPLFDTAEKLEFRDQDYRRALALLHPLTEQSATRAEALLRIARLERKLNHLDTALAAYTHLLQENAIDPDGVPYALLAAGARSELQPHDNAAEQLRAALLEGRWPLHRETFEYYWAEINRLRGMADEPPKDSLEFSLLVSRLYEQWQRAVRTGTSFSGRENETDGSLLMWYASPVRLTALSEPAGWLGTSMKLPAHTGDIRWKWLKPGAAAGAGRYVTRSLAEAQLGGKLELFSISAALNFGLNRPLWLAGVALMVALVLAGAYAMYRGVSRELQVAQLQSDFVSAVSHEFRSPLTTLRTLTELLAHDRLKDEPRRRQSYAFLERETNRLHRLVEDLLDFGRIESGRKQYRIESHDAFQLVRAAVADFSEDAAVSGSHVETNLALCPAVIHADEEALRRALRNLLENAVKYSPDCRTVWVEGSVANQKVAISVRDRGMGIDSQEQRQIFQKFVRGNAAKKAGIKGTGIGLSMVRQIIEAQGGEIRLDSTVGLGSTFTILLPLAANGGKTSG